MSEDTAVKTIVQPTAKRPRKTPDQLRCGLEITMDGHRVTITQISRNPRRPGHYDISGNYQQSGHLRRTGTTRTVAADRKFTVHNWTEPNS
jgi:hypothetical protein